MADMIPQNLAAFRALMERAVQQYEPALGVTRTYAIPEETRQQRQEREHAARRQLHADYDALRALATATPAQLCGIVGRVEPLRHAFLPGDTTITGYVVTPREGEG